jgi:UDP-glucose 4-epimerase
MNQVLQGRAADHLRRRPADRAFSYIDDVAPIIAALPSGPQRTYGQVFNVGGDQPYTVNQLALAVSEIMGVTPDLRYLPARHEVQHAYASHAKARAYFDLPQPTALRAGLGRMAAWVQQVGSRKTQDFAHIEVPIGLPAGW